MTLFSLEVLDLIIQVTPPKAQGRWLLVSQACRQRARIIVFREIVIYCPHSQAAPMFDKLVRRLHSLLFSQDASMSILPLVRKFVLRPFNLVPPASAHKLGDILKLLATAEKIPTPFGNSSLEEFTFSVYNTPVPSFSIPRGSRLGWQSMHQSMQEGISMIANRPGQKVFKIDFVYNLPGDLFDHSSFKELVVTNRGQALSRGSSYHRTEGEEVVTHLNTDFRYRFLRTFHGLKSLTFTVSGELGGILFQTTDVRQAITVLTDARTTLEELSVKFQGEWLTDMHERTPTGVLGSLKTTQFVSLKRLRASQELISTPHAIAINVLPSARLFEVYASQFDLSTTCPLQGVSFEVIVARDEVWEPHPTFNGISPTIDSWQRLDRVFCQPPYFDLTRQRKGQLPLKVEVLLSVVHHSSLDETGGWKRWEKETIDKMRAALPLTVECHGPNVSFVTKYFQNPVPAGWKY